MIKLYPIQVVFLLWMICHPVDGKSQDVVKISGKILSKETNNPVSYAHLKIVNSSIGSITNTNGNFLLVFNKSFIGDTLLISSIAHRPLKIPITTKLTSTELEIYLEKGDLILEETTVIGDAVSAFQLVQKAVSKIDENYDPHPVALNEFYREYVKVHANQLHKIYKNERKAKKKNENFDDSFAYNITEGSFEIYKYPYFGKGGGKDDLVKLLKGRRLEYVPQTVGDSLVQSLTMKFKHKGGPHDMLQHDMLKNPNKYGFLNKNADSEYKFETIGIVNHNGRVAFKVTFDQKDKVKDDLYVGEIFIDTVNYAIITIAFKKSQKGIDYQSLGIGAGMLKLMTGIKIEVSEIHGSLSYQEYKGKWYPEYHTYGGTLKVQYDKEKDKKSVQLDLILEMQGDLLVTGIDKRHARKFDSEEQFKESDHMDDNIGDYNDEFWSTHNYILPSEELKQVINMSKVRNSGSKNRP